MTSLSNGFIILPTNPIADGRRRIRSETTVGTDCLAANLYLWKSVTWEKETVTCDLTSLTQKARTDVSNIIADFNAGTADASTKKRVAQPWIYIRDHGVFPRSLVTMKKVDGLSLIDGSHRMAAFEIVQGLTDAQLAEMGVSRPARTQEVWVGTHCNGEVPAG
jgi:hypothetical protein